MERRNFIGLSIAGVGASLISPAQVLAKAKENNMAGGVFYTKQNPGRWSKKIAGHLPNIEIERAKDKVTVQVVTAHGMDGYKHYIVKHELLDENYNFLDEKMFDPAKDKAPISTFELKNYKGKIYALSMCNKHDVWMNEASI
jgi:superoxide reductase